MNSNASMLEFLEYCLENASQFSMIEENVVAGIRTLDLVGTITTRIIEHYCTIDRCDLHTSNSRHHSTSTGINTASSGASVEEAQGSEESISAFSSADLVQSTSLRRAIFERVCFPVFSRLLGMLMQSRDPSFLAAVCSHLAVLTGATEDMDKDSHDYGDGKGDGNDDENAHEGSIFTRSSRARSKIVPNSSAGMFETVLDALCSAYSQTLSAFVSRPHKSDSGGVGLIPHLSTAARMLAALAGGMHALVMVCHERRNGHRLRIIRRSLLDLFVNLSTTVLSQFFSDDSPMPPGRRREAAATFSVSSSVSSALGNLFSPIAAVYRCLCCRSYALNHPHYHFHHYHRHSRKARVSRKMWNAARSQFDDDQQGFDCDLENEWMSFPLLDRHEMQQHRVFWYSLLVYRVTDSSNWASKPQWIEDFKNIADFSPPLLFGVDSELDAFLTAELCRNALLCRVIRVGDESSKLFTQKLTELVRFPIAHVKVEHKIYGLVVQFLELNRAASSGDCRPMLHYLTSPVIEHHHALRWGI